MNRLPQFEIKVNHEPEGTTPNSPFSGATGKRAYVYSSEIAGEHNIMVEGHPVMQPMSDEEFDRLVKDGTFSHPRPVVQVARTSYLKNHETGLAAHQIISVELNLTDGAAIVQIGGQITVGYKEVRHHNLPPGVWKVREFRLDERGIIHIHLATHSWGPEIERELDLSDLTAELNSKEFQLDRQS